MPDTPDQLPDPDVTIPVAGPAPSIPRGDSPDLPLPAELEFLLPHGNYSVESFLGQGGMGAVYKGTQVRLQRPVAIKIMRRDQGRDYNFEQRFQREALAMAKLNHPNIVSVIDYGEAGPDYLYIVMELVDGADLMDVIRTGRMTQEMALTLLPQICDALQFAHDHGIVHRDIKPSNIMLTRDGRVKMADFGLAKRFDVESSFRTQTGTGMGTPDYAAPEQFDAAALVDHRADIYALGVMIYQMITGQLPRGVWKPPSQRAEIDPQWDDIVSHAMQSDPADRYQKASEIKTDVSSITPKTSAPSPNLSLKGEGKAARAAKSDPSPLRGERLGEGSVARTKKSRAPLLFGLITGTVILAVGAFFALRDSSPRSGAFPTASSSSTANGTMTAPPKSPPTGSAPQAPNPALQNTPAPIVAAAALPESGWKPLFTEQEWRTSLVGKREFKDGRLHMIATLFGKAQASGDASVRARISYQPGTNGPAVIARRSKLNENYKLTLVTTGTPMLALQYFAAGASSGGESLGKHVLAKAPQAGETILLELRIQGNHLAALLNGTVVIEAQDGRIKEAGEWGVFADDAWYESVEVQALPAAAPPAPIAATALPETGWKPLFTEAYWRASDDKREIKDGLLHLTQSSIIAPRSSADGAIRTRIQLRSTNDRPKIIARGSATERYQLMLGAYELWLEVVKPNTGPVTMSKVPLSRVPKAGDEFLMELRIQGGRFIGLLDGVPLIEATDASVTRAGEWGIYGDDAWFESVEVQALPSTPAAPAITATPLPESGWKPLLSDAEWRKDEPGKREFKDGLLHLRLKLDKLVKPQASPDGSIRARIEIREGTSVPSVSARRSERDGNYRLGLGSDGKHVYLAHVPSVALGSFDILGRHFLPKPVAPGDKLVLELRVQGNRLTGLVNGAAVLNAKDDRLKAAGDWIITADDAWFESIEVQNLAAPSSPTAEMWQDLLADSSNLALWDGAAIAGKQMTLPRLGNANLKNPPADGAIRIKTIYAPEAGTTMSLWARQKKTGRREDEQRYELHLGSKPHFRLVHTKGSAVTELAVFPFPVPLHPGSECEVEFEAKGATLTAKLNGTVIGKLNDASISDGSFAAANHQSKPVTITALHFLPLDAPAISSTPSPPVAASSTKFPPGQWVKLFTKAEDLPAELRKPDSRVKFADGWMVVSPGPQNIFMFLVQNQPNIGDWGVRARVKRDSSYEFRLRYSTTKGDRFYGLSPSEVFYGSRDGNEGAVAHSRLLDMGAKGSVPDEFPIEFGIVGSRLCARKFDRAPQMIDDRRLTSGLIALVNLTGSIRDIEVINLDGLPEAEALRLLGVDAKGNDLRGKTGASTITEPWQDVLRDPSDLTLGSKVERTPEGLRFTGIGSAVRPSTWSPRRDGAVRIRAPFGSLAPKLSARQNTKGDKYMLYAADTRRLSLVRWDEPAKKGTVLREFPLREPLKPGQEYEMELRIVGQTLTAKLNAEVLGTASDGTLSEGVFGVLVGEGQGFPVLVKALEVLDLEAPVAGVWRDWIAEQRQAGRFAKHPDLADEGKVVRVVHPQAFTWDKAEFRNGSVRVTLSLPSVPAAEKANMSSLTFRLGKDEKTWSRSYQVAVDLKKNNVALQLYESTKTNGVKWQRIKEWALPAGFDPAKEFSLEARALNDRITVLLNNQEIGSVQDTSVTVAGNVAFYAAEGALVRKFEYQSLDATSAVSLSPSLPASKSSPTDHALASAATKDVPFINTLGMKFVPVPITGGPTDGQRVLFSVWETRVQDYEAFVKETKREWPKPPFAQAPTHPAVMVSWEDAQAFCVWLTDRERKAGKLGAGERYRLPSDHEWSCAVGIGDREDPMKMPIEKSLKIRGVYPWGAQWPPPTGAGNYAGEELRADVEAGRLSGLRNVIAGHQDDFTRTAPVASFAANAIGLYDLGGNACEWCEDWSGEDRKLRVLRGTSWSNTANLTLESAYREQIQPEKRDHNNSFRVVLAPAPIPATGLLPSPSLPASSSPVATANKDAPFINTLGMKFVPVPITGGPTDKQRVLFSVWHVRVQDFEVFAKETKFDWKKAGDVEQEPMHPAVNVSWEDARAFCKWLTERERKAGVLGANEVVRLPGDHEWSCAVGIGELEDAAKTPEEKNGKIADVFPWGSVWPPPKGAGNYAGEELQPALAAGKFSYIKGVLAGYNDGFVNTSPVGSFAANRFGLFDMGGNVWQWCEDWWNKEQNHRVLRGASWVISDRTILLSSNRVRVTPSNRVNHYGFRCVLAASAPAASTSPIPPAPAPQVPAPSVPPVVK